MFSVDNFYTFMDTHYGLEADGRNILYFFRPHGSKDWKNLYGGFIDLEQHRNRRPYYDSKGGIILHDQEPFDQSLLDIYKQQDSIEKKEIWRAHQPNAEVLLLNHDVSLSWPIFCHSELNSPDIHFVEQAGAASCYYFWHGLIARDWFRHWKHNGWISVDKSWQYRFLLYARDFSGSRQYRSKLVNDLLSIKNTVLHNWDQKKLVSSDASAKISEKDSQLAAIHIVAETLFDQEKIHLTEKIFKPMVMLQPFVVLAGPGTLEYLKGYGFKTFSDIWDESYDSTLDHAQRYQQVLDIIYHLSKLSEKKFKQILDRSRSIVQHNHQRFFSNEFEEQMLKELKTNMSDCLLWQQEKNKQFPGGSGLFVVEQQLSRGIYPASSCKRLINAMMFLKTEDRSRYDLILQNHAWLSRNLV